MSDDASYRFSHAVSLQAPSSSSTPRQSAGDDAPNSAYGGLPEGLLASEQGLSASFSQAPASALQSAVSNITCINVNDRLILVGDQTGRSVVYERQPLVADAAHDVLSIKYSHQAFLPEFDCLKSVHIEEKMKAAVFLPERAQGITSYLVANEKTIKFFRMRDGLVTPGARVRNRAVVPLRAFTGAHQFQIHSLGLCSDQETFLSADDFQVHWWHLEAEDTTRAACICDIKPASMDDITELLTAARFHHEHGSLFIMSTSSGRGRLGDLRDPPSRRPRKYSAEFVMNAKYNVVQCSNDDILCSISDISFFGENHVVTRDFLGLKLWDLRHLTEPVQSCAPLQCVVPYLDHLYDCDAIFDRFSLAVDDRTGTVVTGLYDGTVAVWQPRKPTAEVEFYVGSSFPLPEAPNGRLDELRLDWETGRERFLSQKVQSVAIAEGGRSFSFALEENIFVFDRSAEAALASTGSASSRGASPSA